MAGTDSTQPAAAGVVGPAVVLVEPQLGENIGMAARAMHNCALQRLRLVSPREPWPNPKAVAAASGADAILDAAERFECVEDAIADLTRVYATTARPRDMTKRVVTAGGAGAEMRALGADAAHAGVLFGPEARGLDNDAVALADAVITIPLNPAFMSLNLAQAVFAIGYEWYAGGRTEAASTLAMPKETRPANKAELLALFEHLERELDACGFLRVSEKRPVMVRNLRNMLQRAHFTEQEVKTLRGVITGLTRGRRGE